MKQLSLFILLSLFLFSCSSDDPEVSCDFIQAIGSNLYIDLVNEQGENLIENGTYNPDDIIINFNGSVFTGAVFTEVQGIENFITIGVFGEDGDNTYEIRLSDTETDTLILNLTREETGGPCSQFVFILNSVAYNGEIQEIEDFGGDFLITVVKE